MSAARKPLVYPTAGWREWVALPELGVSAVKAKLDTGARTSSLHAFDVHELEIDGRPFVRFKVHPRQRSTSETLEALAPLADRRSVRPSSGHSESRPVILTTVVLGGESWPIEVTLTRRDLMGFRMLLGRQAMRRRMIVDPARSYLFGLAQGRTKTAKTKKKKRKRKR